ncbi:MAG: DUF2087 domain-containing protein [Defluviitaleaceae bacterium]|nr:DUF2087 domain-containing protein [Defluviitaleaceae bacterium]
MDYLSLSLDDLKSGYRFDSDKDAFVCIHCEKSFPQGQVFPIADAFYDAEHAVARHIEAEHGGNLRQLLHSDTKYNTLTDNQKELLSLFRERAPDAEIAKKLNVTASTIRRQKFAFREKAKQARLYLAIFEQVFGGNDMSKDDIVPIHDQAAYYDDRYVITEEERASVLKTYFASLDPPVLKAFPPKEKRKVVILTKIAEQFKPGCEYTEKEVNQIIKAIFEDVPAIRRYLIMYGFLERTTDGAKYWKT